MFDLDQLKAVLLSSWFNFMAASQLIISKGKSFHLNGLKLKVFTKKMTGTFFLGKRPVLNNNNSIEKGHFMIVIWLHKSSFMLEIRTKDRYCRAEPSLEVFF